jgi:hypothetical protein
MVIDLTQQLTAKASSAGGRACGPRAADTETRSQKPPAVSEIFDRPYIETLVNLLRRCGARCLMASVTRPPSRSWEGAAQPFVTGETGIAFASKGREKARAVETLKMAMLQVRALVPVRVGRCYPFCCVAPLFVDDLRCGNCSRAPLTRARAQTTLVIEAFDNKLEELALVQTVCRIGGALASAFFDQVRRAQARTGRDTVTAGLRAVPGPAPDQPHRDPGRQADGEGVCARDRP